MKYTKLGALISRYRFDANLTQTELAQRAHLSLASVQKLEQGVKDNPSLVTVRRLAKALGVRTVDLIPDYYEDGDPGDTVADNAADASNVGCATGWKRQRDKQGSSDTDGEY